MNKTIKLIIVIALCVFLIVSVIIALGIVLSQNGIIVEQEGKTCADADNNNGICKPIDECMSALEKFKKHIDLTICGYYKQVAVVCCVNASTSVEAFFSEPTIPNYTVSNNISTVSSSTEETISDGSKTNDNVSNNISTVSSSTEETISDGSKTNDNVSHNISTVSSSTEEAISKNPLTNYNGSNNTNSVNNITGKHLEEKTNTNDSCTDNLTKTGKCNSLPTLPKTMVNYFKDSFIIPDLNKDNFANDYSFFEDPDEADVDDIRNGGAISKAKCKEYAKYAYKKIVSPILSTNPQEELIYECNDDVQTPIIGKRFVSRKEFPHTVLLGNLVFGDFYVYNCGGSLISEIFVLTSSSCLIPDSIQRRYALLGVTDINAAEHKQIIKVAEEIEHPMYSKKDRYNNIGLVRLEHPVEINEFVRPACVNTLRNLKYKKAVEYEWGVYVLKDGSGGVVKSIMDITPQHLCPQRQDDPIICVTISSDQRNDPCKNFQGSALVSNDQNPKELQCMSTIIGLRVFVANCGVGEQNLYTRVSAYVDWIEEIVWPELYSS